MVTSRAGSAATVKCLHLLAGLCGHCGGQEHCGVHGQCGGLVTQGLHSIFYVMCCSVVSMMCSMVSSVIATVSSNFVWSATDCGHQQDCGQECLHGVVRDVMCVRCEACELLFVTDVDQLSDPVLYTIMRAVVMQAGPCSTVNTAVLICCPAPAILNHLTYKTVILQK